MRRVIDTAPKDGTFVILEDDVSGSFESAQWSADGRGWIKKNGEPSEITATHWLTKHLPEEGDEFILQDEFIPPKETGSIAPPASPMPRSFCFPAGLAERARVTELTRLVTNVDPVVDALLEARAAQSEHERGPTARRAISSIAAVMVGASLIGWYFYPELLAHVSRNLADRDSAKAVKQEAWIPRDDPERADSSARELTLQQQADRTILQTSRDTVHGKPAAEAMQPKAQQLSEPRVDALAKPARSREIIEMQIAQANRARDQAAQRNQAAEQATVELRQSLKKEQDRAYALTGELAKTRRDLETQLALSSKASDEATQAKKAAESVRAELRQSLKKEHDRAEALTGELARVREELQTQLALSSKAGGGTMQVKKVAKGATAELRQSLKERDTARAPAPGHELTLIQAAEAAATEQPKLAEAQGDPEVARLLARASALLVQGDIGAARIVLEHAVGTGSAKASFMLAETYDPHVLSTWKTFGTRGDVTKARELYAKALAGGIQRARDRSVALQ
jgi:hypothetical protein